MVLHIRASSNGKKADFDSANVGSTPAARAILLVLAQWQCGGLWLR